MVETVSVAVEEGVEGRGRGRIVGAPVVVEAVALDSVPVGFDAAPVGFDAAPVVEVVVLTAAAVMDVVVLAAASVVEVVALASVAVDVVERPLGTGTGTWVDSVTAESVEVEAMEAPTAESELAVEEMADATEADEAATAAEATDVEAVAKGTMTGDNVTEPVGTDALAGMMMDVVYPLIAIGRTGPDGAGCCTELGILPAMEVTWEPGPARTIVVVATPAEGLKVTVAEASVV